MIRISAYLLSSAIGSVIMFPQLIMFFFSFFYSCACHRARPIPTTRSLRRICRWTMNVKRSAGRPNAWPWPNSTRPEWVPFFFFFVALLNPPELKTTSSFLSHCLIPPSSSSSCLLLGELHPDDVGIFALFSQWFFFFFFLFLFVCVCVVK